MIDYEILLLFDAELPEERQNEIVTRTRELVERGGGTFESHDVWGRRRLAYEIDHKGEGTYHLLTFTAEPGTLDEISRVLKITDGVLRHLAKAGMSRGAGVTPRELAASIATQGKPGAKDKTSGTPVTTFKRSTPLYNANTKSDRDHDGIACEAA